MSIIAQQKNSNFDADVARLSSRAEAVACAKQFVPTLRERAAHTEELRRIPEETIAELRASGLLGILTPKCFGGAELGIATLVEVTSELAQGCVSSGWVFGNLIGHYWLLAQFPLSIYVTLFALGHSMTLLGGVLGSVNANTWLVDAIIGLSVAYKAFDNLDGFRTLFGVTPNRCWAVLLFGLCHGFGRATKLQELHLSGQGLIPNLLAFHVGIELGQLLALSLMMALLLAWRRSARFDRQAISANVLMLGAGFLLTGYQLAGFCLQRGVVP
ncbi:HupE/UreJ family protein [Glaciimonas sp. PCH181]|uniref:HupE/UreJ family protein n=1 Tax=Glaciimonas sp. PCH181 TaxID=2133943 RepID=UPI000D3C57E8|nr:HupE/UreJ family protein [Glaciimonas sp. PCH181]PUA20362.1 hypothetical protein C7W93_11560 [Glaciimonas sp. PCH181]